MMKPPRRLLPILCLLLCALSPRPGLAAPAVRVAVLEFDNGSPQKDLDALGKGLQSMLTTDLAQVPSLSLVERARLGDVQAELKLGKSGQLDPKTAARLGKLAGATHLLAGTFTVLGERMRLDARLFAVEGGAVVLAEKNEGEKDAFFELEKTLVARLIDALGVKLKPKERAELARVHTADFEAFRSFSQGVALFDDKRYQEAVTALRDATSRDKDFKLAALTLTGYEQLIDKLRAQTGELRSAEDELKRLGQRQKQSAEAQALERLWEVARRKGREHQYDRLAAVYELALAYGDIGNHSDHPRALQELSKTEDRFAMRRTGDALCQGYYAEAVKLFPEVPPIVSETVTYGRSLPSDPTKVGWVIEQTRKNLLELGKGEGGRGMGQRNMYLREVLADPEGSLVDGMGFMGRMHLDMRQAAAFRQRLFELGDQAPGTPAEMKGWRQLVLGKLGKAYRVALDIDRSTALYTRAGKESGDSQGLAQATREVETNRDLAKLLAGPGPRELRELLQLKLAAEQSYPENALREAGRLFAGAGPGAALSPAAAYALSQLRRYPRHHEQYLLIGEAPTWAVMGAEHLLTGPRTDPLRADEIRYHRAPPRSNNPMYAEPPDTVLVLGAQPGRAVELKLEVSFAAPPDFWPPEERPRQGGPQAGAPVPGRPEVGVLFGLQDVEAGEEVDDKTGQKTLRALRGGLLLVRPDGVAAGEVLETERKRSFGRGAQRTLQLSTPEVRRADLRGPVVPVTVRVQGGAVQATVGDKSYSFKGKGEGGFAGLLFRGVGYAAVRRLSVGVKP